jgi:hypothetical protein
LGTEDGLYCLTLSSNDFVKITDKKVLAIEFVDEPGLEVFVIISGNRRTIRLLPKNCIFGESDTGPIKIEETKGATLFCVGPLRQLVNT